MLTSLVVVIEGGQSFAEQCVVIRWLEEAGVDFFDISGGTYESPAWRGNIMTELAERPSQKTRGRFVHPVLLEYPVLIAELEVAISWSGPKK